MKHAYLEHANITVKNPEELAALFCRLFAWKIRWEGGSVSNGRSIHVGNDDSYIALYTHENLEKTYPRNHLAINNMNHLGIVVTDIDELERKVKEEGYEPINHADYDPGKRFYFLIDQLEIEIISYADKGR